MTQINRECGEHDGKEAGTGAEHRDADELCTPREDEKGHSPDLKRAQACLLRYHAEGKTYRDVAETDGPGRAYTFVKI